MGLADADPLPRIVAYLGAHPGIRDAFGGADRVGVSNVPPYPRIVIDDGPAGSLRDGRWLIAPRFTVAVLDDITAPLGRAALRRLFLTVVDALVDLPNVPATDGPVITHVAPVGGGGWSPTGRNQPRYVQPVEVYAHPRPDDAASATMAAVASADVVEAPRVPVMADGPRVRVLPPR